MRVETMQFEFVGDAVFGRQRETKSTHFAA